MAEPVHPPAGRPGRLSAAAVVVYLTAFAILLLVVAKWYLIPSLVAFQGATPDEKLKLAAVARLILALLLLILLAALSITFRIGRFFFPRPSPPRTQTRYVDAWAEAGRRAAAGEDETEEKMDEEQS